MYEDEENGVGLDERFRQKKKNFWRKFAQDASEAISLSENLNGDANGQVERSIDVGSVDVGSIDIG